MNIKEEQKQWNIIRENMNTSRWPEVVGAINALRKLDGEERDLLWWYRIKDVRHSLRDVQATTEQGYKNLVESSQKLDVLMRGDKI